MQWILSLNALVPFRTRTCDDGLVHVRAWTGPGRPHILVAEMDWAVLVADRRDAYFGPGVFTYPEHAMAAVHDRARSVGLHDPQVIVRMPAPPGERYDVVVDVDDPQGWRPTSLQEIRDAMPGADVAAPGPGRYTRRTVDEWVRLGVIPPT